MGSDQEKLFGIVYTEAEDRKEPFSLDDIDTKLKKTGTKRQKEELEVVIEKLCMIGVLTATRDGWICSKYLQTTTQEPDPDRTKDLVPKPQVQITTSSQEPEPDRTKDLVPKTQVQITNTSSASSITYTCEVESLEVVYYKLHKIVEVLKESTTPLRGNEIARRCEIGTTKSAVNRYLYCLEKKGILAINNNQWSYLREPDDDALTVYAAELAERKPSKKQQAKTGQSSECEYGCEKKTGNCYHFKQENHYYQHFAQVGDGNTYEFHSHGEDKLKK